MRKIVLALALLILGIGSSHSENSDPRKTEGKTDGAENGNKNRDPFNYTRVPPPFWSFPYSIPPIINVYSSKHANEISQCTEPKNWEERSYFAWCRFWEWIDAERAIAIFTAILGIATWRLWIATKKLVRGAEATERRSLRAYVGITDIELEFPNLDTNFALPDPLPPGFVFRDLVIVTIKNFGATPAAQVLTVVNWWWGPFGNDLADNFEFRDIDTRNTIPRASRAILDRDIAHVTRISMNQLQPFREAHARRLTIHFYGHIDYSDAYDRRWRREFCFIWEPWHTRGARHIPYRVHNTEYQISKNDPGIFPTP